MTLPTIELIAAPALVLFGIVCAVHAISSWRVVRRALVLRSTGASPGASPGARTARVRDLTSGSARVDGVLRAIDPVPAMDGSPAVALRRSICVSVSDGECTHSTAPRIYGARCVVEVSDGDDACVVELAAVEILGPQKTYKFKPDDFETRHPGLWADLRPEPGETIEEVSVEETAVPDGARGFVVGEATLDDEARGTGTSLDRRLRWRFRASPQVPAVLSAWDDKTARRVLRAPMIGLAWLALLAWALAGLAIALPNYLGAA